MPIFHETTRFGRVGTLLNSPVTYGIFWKPEAQNTPDGLVYYCTIERSFTLCLPKLFLKQNPPGISHNALPPCSLGLPPSAYGMLSSGCLTYRNIYCPHPTVSSWLLQHNGSR